MKNTCFEEKVGCNETEHNYGFDRYLASKVMHKFMGFYSWYSSVVDND